MAGDGVLEAASCEVQATNAVRTEWEVEAVDTVASTVTVLGVTWEVRPETELEDDSDAEVDPLQLGDLSLGDLLQVRGYMDGSTPVAVRLERDDAFELDDVEVRRLGGLPTSTLDFDPRGVVIANEAPRFEIRADDTTVTLEIGLVTGLVRRIDS